MSLQPTEIKPQILRTFTIPISSPNPPTPARTISIHITEPPHIKADNLTLETWASSQILARALHTLSLASSISDLQPTEPNPQSNTNQPLPILELGAGTALVGLTATALLRPSAPPIFTDLPSIVPGIAANIAANRALLPPSTSSTPRAGSLDWRTPDYISLPDGTKISSTRKARIVFAADTIYDEAHPELLERVVKAWLERHREAKFVICYSLRVAYLDQIRELWRRMEEGVGLVATAEGREEGEATNGDDELLCEWVVWQWADLR